MRADIVQLTQRGGGDREPGIAAARWEIVDALSGLNFRPPHPRIVNRPFHIPEQLAKRLEEKADQAARTAPISSDMRRAAAARDRPSVFRR